MRHLRGPSDHEHPHVCCLRGKRLCIHVTRSILYETRVLSCNMRLPVHSSKSRTRRVALATHTIMPPRSTKPPTTDSLLPPILANLSSTPPNPYSAHQKALTTTARLAAAKHHDIAIEICFTVARELLKLGEPGSGVELAVRGLGYMVDSEVNVDDKTRGMFGSGV